MTYLNTDMNLTEKMFKNILEFSSGDDRSLQRVEEFLTSFYNDFDRYQKEELFKGQYIVDCKAGCSECCNHWVEDVYGFESELIFEKLKNDYPEKIREIAQSAKDSIDSFESVLADDLDSDELVLLNRFYQERVPCPLLDENGLCMIYSNRPLTCRGFFSENFEKYCSVNGDEDQRNGTYMLLPPEKIQSLLDDIHLKWYQGFPTSLRSVLSFIA